jgi:hypothetical protein
MLQEAFLAAAQFVSLPFLEWQLGVLCGDAIPKIFNKLQALSSSQFEKRREFLVHE